MRTLKKMTIGELQKNSNEILERERMKAIKGGGGGCYVYCTNGYSWGIVDDCFDGGNKICGINQWICSGC